MLKMRTVGYGVAVLSLLACGGAPDGDGAQALGEVTQALGHNFVTVDLESPSFLGQNSLGAPEVEEDTLSFPIKRAGSALAGQFAAANQPYISSNTHFGTTGSRSLQLTLPPRVAPSPFPPGNPDLSDRAEVSVYQSDFTSPAGLVFGFGHPLYYGFAMRVHGASDRLDGGVVFMQAWQGNDSCGVPLHGTLQQDKPVLDQNGVPISSEPQTKFYIHTHSNAGSHEVVAARPITKGDSHTFVFYLDPSPNNDQRLGHVQVWMDGAEIAPFQELDWGCNEVNPQNAGEWQIRAGAYRTYDAQDPGFFDTAHQEVFANKWLYMFVDNLRLGTDFASADPRMRKVGQ